MSKKLNRAQTNYSTAELECLAVVLAIKGFRMYIDGHQFTVVTDHASLRWLMTQQDLQEKLAWRALKLQGFNFSIEQLISMFSQKLMWNPNSFSPLSIYNLKKR